MNKEILNDENVKNVSFRIPENLKNEVVEFAEKYNLPLSKALRLFVFYGVKNQEKLVDDMTNAEINYIKNTIKDSKTVTLSGYTIRFDRYEVLRETNKIVVNFYIKDELVMTKEVNAMTSDLKFE